MIEKRSKTGMQINHRAQDWLLARRVEHAAIEAVSRFVDGLRSLEASPPIYVGISVLGVSGAIVAVRNIDYLLEYPARITRPNLSLPICVIEDFGEREQYVTALKPALDALWNAGGLAEWQAEA